MAQNKPKNIIFFVRHFLERGTEVAIYQYAHYNEIILGNKSYIACFTKEHPWRANDTTYGMFERRFSILELAAMEDITQHIDKHNIHLFYTLTHGGEDIYKFNIPSIWKTCKTIKHCVFTNQNPESDYYCCISEYLAKKDGMNLPVFPHMVELPDTSENLRELLQIPANAIVFGGYGGKENFNIPYVRQLVEIVAKDNFLIPIYFLFANFQRFCEESPRILHLPVILDPMEKVKFINTCDAMLWAREDGETFGLAIAEFSSKNKPILCTESGDLAHRDFLGDKGLWYTCRQTLLHILLKFTKESVENKDWNCYREYTPEKVMAIFDRIVNDCLETKGV